MVVSFARAVVLLKPKQEKKARHGFDPIEDPRVPSTSSIPPADLVIPTLSVQVGMSTQTNICHLGTRCEKSCLVEDSEHGMI